MGLRVIPTKLFVAAPDFVAIGLDLEWPIFERQALPDEQTYIAVKKQFAAPKNSKKNQVSSRGGLPPPVRSEPKAGRRRGRPYA